MDIWIWYCRFEDCDRGIYNVMGNWHAWHNLFLRSRTCDLGTQNLMAFPVVGNTSNKQAAPKGFEFLANLGDTADPARSQFGSGPLSDNGGVDDATTVRHLASLREARVWLPEDTRAKVTDVRIHRLMVSGGRGATVEFRFGR